MFDCGPQIQIFDGTINLWDDDDDDDGVLDINDDFSLDECASLDTDNDGMPDTIISSCSTTLVEDLDDDNDGWSDVNETNCDTNSISSLSVPIDTDSDGICNYIDSDDDGDGWSDVQENGCEANTFSSFRAFSIVILIVILLQAIAESYTLVESNHLNSVIWVVLLHIRTQECGDGHQIRLRLVP